MPLQESLGVLSRKSRGSIPWLDLPAIITYHRWNAGIDLS